jgi:hypothetical protein
MTGIRNYWLHRKQKREALKALLEAGYKLKGRIYP